MGDATPQKPQRASEYSPTMLEAVRATCLYVATILGDLLSEHIVIVGGLVPYLLIRQDGLSDADRHIGTQDLDLGFSIAVLDEERYEIVAQRLTNAGFRPDRSANNQPTRQRWRIDPASGPPVTVDFLIPPTNERPTPGPPLSLREDLAAIVTPGLELAFQDRIVVTLEGRTVNGEWARRAVAVCGPGAFVVLKSLAFRNRGERKDAYDLYYVVRHYGATVEDVAARLRPLLRHPDAGRAIEYLREDFDRSDAVGPKRVAAFLGAETDDTILADARAFVLELLDSL